jgi:transcriptional regulator with XRE-family HTH domain|tara:strand:- start:882 stop:1256 length:375 start_codon:yes stop_codon:yes gene_type:complete
LKNLGIEMAEDYTKEISQKLKKHWQIYKKKNKVSQTDFAENELRVSQGNFSNYLNANVTYSLKLLIELSRALEIEIWEILPDDFLPPKQNQPNNIDFIKSEIEKLKVELDDSRAKIKALESFID